MSFSTIAKAGRSALLATLLTAATGAAAEPPAVELGAPFADLAVLQRDMQVPVWGWTTPGATVTVEFAGQKKSATAGQDGKWMLELDPLPASAEPRPLTVTESTGDTRTLKDLLVGEVWLASGQSNMQWIVSKCDTGRVLLKGIEERVAAGEEEPPAIREAKITDYFAHLHPIEHATGEWSEAGGDSSAIAFAFAYKLHRELGVPVGILNCSFSQTAIQAWTPRCGFAGGEDDYTKKIYAEILQTDPSTPEHRKAWDAFYADIEKTIAENKERVANGEEPQEINTKTPGNMSGNRDASWLFNARLNPMIPYAIRGAIWNQGYANMGEGLPYYHNLHSMIRGWRQLWERPDLPVYFHQFYCPNQKEWDNSPTIESVAEMRLGTWLARDIPHTGMASQIDITGAIHYSSKTLPGQRLALHALKNQYGKDVVADGPMFRSYEVQGDRLVVTFDHAADGLVVAATPAASKDTLAVPEVIPDGAGQVKLFYLAGEDRVWHPATVTLDGNKAIVTSPAVKEPKGVSYATGGVGPQPALFNRAHLPATPFICYDQKLVTSEWWPEEKLKVAGEVIDPATVGKSYEYRKMPLLSTQFRDNAVLQAGVPVTIWGSAIHDWGYEADGEAVIHFRFAGIEKTIPVTPGMKEWQVTLPPMEPGSEPGTLEVRFTIDGELAHERVVKGIVFGDVYYVAAPPLAAQVPAGEKSPGIVRMMTRKAKRFAHDRPSRFSVCVSTTPGNRFASEWTEAEGFAAALGHAIGRKTGNPVGIIFMQTAGSGKADGGGIGIKSWIHPEDLKLAPTLMEDYKDLGAVRPGNRYYDANARRYIDAWKVYWGDYIPEMIATKAVPDGAAWGSYPSLASAVTSDASEVYNVMVHSFTPTALKGIVFLASEDMVAGDQGAAFGPELAALATSFRTRFGSEDAPFIHTIPAASLAPKLGAPDSIDAPHAAVEVTAWDDPAALQKLIDTVVSETTK